MTSFGPMEQSVFLLTFVTLNKSKSHHGLSGNETDNYIQDKSLNRE